MRTHKKGTALVTEHAHIAANHCRFASGCDCLGIVCKTGNSTHKRTISLRGCDISGDPDRPSNMWGGFFAKDASHDDEVAMLAANTFEDNAAGDICREFEDTGFRLQPWRRGWTDTVSH